MSTPALHPNVGEHVGALAPESAPTSVSPAPWEAVQLAGLDSHEAQIEYLRRCVERGAPGAFYGVLATDEHGTADVCHTGNGPRSKANAESIAALHNAVEAHKAAEQIPCDVWAIVGEYSEEGSYGFYVACSDHEALALYAADPNGPKPIEGDEAACRPFQAETAGMSRAECDAWLKGYLHGQDVAEAAQPEDAVSARSGAAESLHADHLQASGNVSHRVSCDVCRGKGSVWATVPKSWGPATIRKPCDACRGRGWVESWTDCGVKSRHWRDVVALTWFAVFLLAAVAYLVWLDSVAGGGA